MTFQKAKAGLVCFVTAFLLPFCPLHLENRITVCMGYPAMTSQERAGKRRRKGAGKPCRENGAPNVNWSRWVDMVNGTKRHSPKKLMCYGSPHVFKMITWGKLPQPEPMWTICPHQFYPRYPQSSFAKRFCDFFVNFRKDSYILAFLDAYQVRGAFLLQDSPMKLQIGDKVTLNATKWPFSLASK